MTPPALPLAPAPGRMGVDFEERVDFGRLRATGSAGPGPRWRRPGAARCCCSTSTTSATRPTWIGGALGDKMSRYALLTRDRRADAVGLRLGGRHHRLYCPVARAGELQRRSCSRAGRRPAARPDRRSGARDQVVLATAGVAGEPVGMDIVEPPFLFELSGRGIR